VEAESNGLMSRQELIDLERKFFSGVRREKLTLKGFGLEILKGWGEYITKESGDQELLTISRSHILFFGRWLSGRIKYEELRRTLFPSEKIFERPVCYATQKDELTPGTVLGDLAIESLTRKYGVIPDSFVASVNGCGDIEYRRVTCKNCSFFTKCNLRENCNCYNAAEFNRRQSERSEKLSEIETYINKYCKGS